MHLGAYYPLILCALLSACFMDVPKSRQTPPAETTRDTLTLFDAARKRPIPVALYHRKIPQKNEPAGMVVLSHGYGANAGDSYLHYAYLTDFLAEQGYFVVSIQHELPTDSLIPSVGKPQVVRRPFWERGADNILFVIRELPKMQAQLEGKPIVLLGHSNGGDMSALFPQKYPGIVSKIITLDNRRMSLPRSARPQVYSLRSSDQPADEGVLPTEAEQRRFGITIVPLPGILHNDMSDNGTAEQKQEIRTLVLRFLKE